ncbi:hypothetical protein TWF481_006942 [Arthrobotrys musiformis]|uniref:Secreted protein n=1 Tax=Arthrobotrys musiformis TaxID=47236 RepID=A0AAV9WAZ0_9PEZI
MNIIFFFTIATQLLFTTCTASPVESDQTILKDGLSASENDDFHAAWNVVGSLPPSLFYCGPRDRNGNRARFDATKIKEAIERASDIWYGNKMTGGCTRPATIRYPQVFHGHDIDFSDSCPHDNGIADDSWYEFPILPTGLYCSGTNQGAYRVIYQEAATQAGKKPYEIRYCGITYHIDADTGRCHPN